jgi:ABC-type multidrug transport system fused ATPase/permease subunit
MNRFKMSKDSNSFYALILRLWVHITLKRKRQLIVLFLLSVLTSFAEVISLGAVLPFLSVLTTPEKVFHYSILKPFILFLHLTEPKQLILPITLAFTIAVILSGMMRLLLLSVQTRLSFSLGGDFSYKIYRNSLFQSYLVHTKQNTSQVITGLTKASGLVSSVILPIFTIFGSGLILIMILGALLAIDSKVSILAFAGFSGFYIAINQIMKGRLKRESIRINNESVHVLKSLQEGLGGIRDVLIDGTQNTFCEIFKNADTPSRKSQANIAIIAGSPRYVIEAIGLVLIAVFAYSLTKDLGNLVNAIPVLGALALGSQRMLPMLQQLYVSITTIRGAEASIRTAIDLLEQSIPKSADTRNVKPIIFNNEFSLNNISFQYDSNLPLILNEFNLTIKKGSRIGLIGSTGSGKSTILDIIMGLLEPNRGHLAVDGIHINQTNNRSWQMHIAHVPQAIFLADTSIYGNIAFGVPENQIDHQRVKDVAKKAQIASTIESWNNDYNTFVGERGIRLSGGQRQRLGIARALYKNADVIVFDEATSALDSQTENDVMNAIEGLSEELTIIMVAHRVSTLKNCTKIIEFEKGEIKRIGTYKEIINN